MFCYFNFFLCILHPNIGGELVDVSGPYFAKRVKMLETFSALRCCVLFLDIDCEDVKIFFSIIRLEFLILYN